MKFAASVCIWVRSFGNIRMQNISLVLACSDRPLVFAYARMIHAWWSFAKWSALHPRVESISLLNLASRSNSRDLFEVFARFCLKLMYVFTLFYPFIFYKKKYLPATPEDTSPWRKTCWSPSQQTFGISVPLIRELQRNLNCAEIFCISHKHRHFYLWSTFM